MAAKGVPTHADFVKLEELYNKVSERDKMAYGMNIMTILAKLEDVTSAAGAGASDLDKYSEVIKKGFNVDISAEAVGQIILALGFSPRHLSLLKLQDVVNAYTTCPSDDAIIDGYWRACLYDHTAEETPSKTKIAKALGTVGLEPGELTFKNFDAFMKFAVLESYDPDYREALNEFNRCGK